MRRASTFLLSVALTLLASSAQAGAFTTFDVSNTADSGTGTLRAALAAAADGDVIAIAPGDYAVSSAGLAVTKAVTIRGAGANLTTLRADGDNRVMGIALTPGPVQISDLTMTGGDNEEGAGLLASGQVRLDRVAIVDNGSLPGINCCNGGGISMAGGADLVVSHSLIAGNKAYNSGAIDPAGTLLIEDSTLANNQAGSFMPGDNGDGGALDGGDSDHVTIRGSTIAGNSAYNGPSSPGGIRTATVERSIIAGNLAFDNAQPADPGVPDDCGQPTVSLGGNIESATSCGFTMARDLQNANPLLGALAANGGPTMTMALPQGSPAVDRAGPCTGTDQRGVARPQLGGCDSGAFEFQPPPPPEPPLTSVCKKGFKLKKIKRKHKKPKRKCVRKKKHGRHHHGSKRKHKH